MNTENCLLKTLPFLLFLQTPDNIDKYSYQTLKDKEKKTDKRGIEKSLKNNG